MYELHKCPISQLFIIFPKPANRSSVVSSSTKLKIVDGIENIQKLYLHLAENHTARALVDYTISFLEAQQGNFTSGIEASDHARFDELEVPGGIELRQLESCLRGMMDISKANGRYVIGEEVKTNIYTTSSALAYQLYDITTKVRSV
ncbi:hypothetical protein BGX21_002791 [Mortierella sp. AD011]|nr:hypothetical protein BGX21_002791 [Mortierella sp. AD011]